MLPYLRLAVDAGTLSGTDARLVESAAARAADVAGPDEPPSRIHGDLWSGNVLWSGGSGWLIDPAAHGGHRETDLAMLALFGAPYLDRILGAYASQAPLAPGWRQRVPLHQLHPLLVHVVLFGARLPRGGAAAAVRAALARNPILAQPARPRLNRGRLAHGPGPKRSPGPKPQPGPSAPDPPGSGPAGVCR